MRNKRNKKKDKMLSYFCLISTDFEENTKCERVVRY